MVMKMRMKMKKGEQKNTAEDTAERGILTEHSSCALCSALAH